MLPSRLNVSRVAALVSLSAIFSSPLTAVAEQPAIRPAAIVPQHGDGCRENRNRCIRRVLLISIDGMHDVDLQRFVATHPYSTLGRLSESGLTYTNAHAPVPTDSFPGMLALATGGHPGSTGVYYEVNYDRSLYPPKSNCTGTPGTIVAFDESIDYDPNAIDAGGGINPVTLTEQKIGGTCRLVFPHDYLRVNTIFEAIKSHYGRTAWSDKEHSYEMLNGPSGNGVDDLYDREINAGMTTSSINATEAYDHGKVLAILNEIDGKSSVGVAGVGVPAIFGMNFQAVSVGQKLAFANFGVGPRGGYLDAYGTPTPLFEQAIEFTDSQIGLFVAELYRQHLADSTLLIISAKHGQAPIDIHLRRGIAGAAGSFGTQLSTNHVGFVQTDDLALIWLTDRSFSNLQAAYKELSEPAFKAALGYDQGQLFAPSNYPSGWGPFQDPRTPDFAVKVNLGVIYTGGTKIAEHGGFSDQDSHVALLVARASCNDRQTEALWANRWRTVAQPVQTAQVAPTILKVLGIDPRELQAVQLEGTRVLPQLGF